MVRTLCSLTQEKQLKANIHVEKTARLRGQTALNNTALKHRVRLLVVSIGGGQDLCEVRHL